MFTLMLIVMIKINKFSSFKYLPMNGAAIDS